MPAPPNKIFHFWLEETAILDMQMSKLPMISGYVLYSFLDAPSPYACTQSLDFLIQKWKVKVDYKFSSIFSNMICLYTVSD
jgi:hypothetical protein